MAQGYARFVPTESITEPVDLVESTLFKVVGVAFEIGIGAIGGLIGGALFRTKPGSPPAAYAGAAVDQP
jgi:hypothetical protein